MTVRKYLSALVALALLLSWQSAGPAGLPDFSDLAAKCGPAVVNINTERKASGGDQDDIFGEMFRNMPPGFEKFFDQFGMRGGKRPQMRQKSLGSGFIISEDGYIVTNNHVVADADVIRVTLDQSTGKSEAIPAKLIGADEETDLALLKVDVKKPLPFLSFGDSAALQVGNWVLAIGNPFGLDHTVTAGILSAKNRNIHAGPFDNFLQTDASINPGNSGGLCSTFRGRLSALTRPLSPAGRALVLPSPAIWPPASLPRSKAAKKSAAAGSA